LSPRLTKYYAMKTCPVLNERHAMKPWGVEVYLHAFLTSALGGLSN